ncbi:FHA domain-containing protein [Leptolyngbya sp. CCNP1308]|uniref:FHA domain-containing protein n=1 Tax=Leptolyngbya sp. CCNP1308 TaxID=3110255 RepID=UPI002B2199C0|nr:FHA domain-containing protein [Leptolyngbya sp. CCNP1308]MEA5448239.1 FHA domain-containing protein [Leptolyngbya sp. CCNP1308]
MKLNQEREIHPLNPLNSRQFILLLQDGERQKTIPLSRSFYSIGRDQDRDIQLSHPGVSRYHASLVCLSNGYQIIDGEPGGRLSRNGVHVNGKVIKKKIIKAGDRIVFCKNVRGEVKDYLSISQEEKMDLEHSFYSGNLDCLTPSDSYVALEDEAESNLFSTCPDLFIKVDFEGRLLSFQNGNDAELPRLSSEHLGRPISKFFPVNFSLNLFKHIRQVEKNGGLHSFETSLPRNGNPLFCELRIFSATDHNQIIIIRNINQRKSLEKKTQD